MMLPPPTTMASWMPRVGGLDLGGDGVEFVGVDPEAAGGLQKDSPLSLSRRGIGIGGLGPGGGGDGRPEGPRPVDFAVVPEVELAAMLESESLAEESPTPSIGTLDPAAAASDTLPAAGIGDPLGGVGESSLGELSIGGGAALSDGDGLGIGSGIGSGGGGGANFFGVEASGSRFAYILDMSGSMNWDGKLDVLRAELARSIENMTDQNEFVVILFSDIATIMGERSQWVMASDAGKKWARRSISAVRADGGTNPTPGFVSAFGMRPRPDAIYFMTDGEFSDPDGVVAEVNALNSQLKVPVHCICFVTSASEPVMRKIAGASGGSYTFVPKK
jgi:hypothetical protein